ncbi:hypothetical protein BGP_0237 [Beggiatoa sp. PS]|nr:hypothetical protein BGP_0237 [Beggiatoa sp. PS]
MFKARQEQFRCTIRYIATKNQNCLAILKTLENFCVYSIFKGLRGYSQLKIKYLQISQAFSEQLVTDNW